MPAIAAEPAPLAAPKPVAAKSAAAPKPVVKSLKPDGACEAEPSDFAQTLEDALSGDAAIPGEQADATVGEPIALPQAEPKLVAATASIVDMTMAEEPIPSASDEPSAPQWLSPPAAPVLDAMATEDEPIEAAPDFVEATDKPLDDSPTLLAGVESVVIAQPLKPVADEGPRAMPLQRLAAVVPNQPNEDASPATRPQPGETAAEVATSSSIELPPDIVPVESETESTQIEAVPEEPDSPEPLDILDPEKPPTSSERPMVHPVEKAFNSILQTAFPQPAEPAPTPVAEVPHPALPPAAPESRFIDDNHPRIIHDVRTALSAGGGGKMELRLDPPELGALSIRVEMRDGLMTASFQTSSDEATRLLSHSLAQLKHSLESTGVSVDRLQVQQAPKQDFSHQFDRDPRDQSRQPSEDNTRHEQQRREMLQRMWQRLRNNGDPVDLFA